MNIQNIKNRIIKALGGYTKEEYRRQVHAGYKAKHELIELRLAICGVLESGRRKGGGE